ncbi:hypothetical protein PILCRDRAFT_827340 [Piloderma croceum F 1598]|uniref:RNase III domain-containing protein n=1 Tax=Piloderma croceum (strain F 1598) TaxID=765440 RepID=A0A0C3BDN9_PILCF|nr:hypothetical protein PILCRDRAFT_827340 [Piloderma croceum F 1598]
MLSPGQKHSFIQNALIVAINDPSFKFTLPELCISTWDDLLTSSNASHERERLEFVGDALMHACVALELYKQFPDATPGLYTTLRAALNANATFTHLMIHVGAFEDRSTGRPKIAADAFEIVIGSYYMERGFDALCTWVADMLKPLIAVAAQAFIDFSKECVVSSKGQKRLRDQGPSRHRRVKTARGQCSLRPSGHRLTVHEKKAPGPTLQSSVITGGLSIPRVEIIDLTGSDGSDDEWTDSEDLTGIDKHPCSLSQSHSKPHVPSPLPTVSQLSLGDSETTIPAADAMGPLSSVSLVLNDVTSISTNTLGGNSGISDTTGASRSSDGVSSFATQPLSSRVMGGGTSDKAPHGMRTTIPVKATLPSLAKVRAITKGLRNVSSNKQRQGDFVPMHPSRLSSPVRTAFVAAPRHFQTQDPSSSTPRRPSGVIQSLPDVAYGHHTQKARLGGPETPIVIDDDTD